MQFLLDDLTLLLHLQVCHFIVIVPHSFFVSQLAWAQSCTWLFPSLFFSTCRSHSNVLINEVVKHEIEAYSTVLLLCFLPSNLAYLFQQWPHLLLHSFCYNSKESRHFLLMCVICLLHFSVNPLSPATHLVKHDLCLLLLLFHLCILLLSCLFSAEIHLQISTSKWLIFSIYLQTMHLVNQFLIPRLRLINPLLRFSDRYQQLAIRLLSSEKLMHYILHICKPLR